MSILNAVFLIAFSLIAGQLLALVVVYAAFGHRYNSFWDYVKSYFKEEK